MTLSLGKGEVARPAIDDNAVGGGKVENHVVDHRHLKDGAVEEQSLHFGAGTRDVYGGDAATSGKVYSSSATGDKIADRAIDARHIRPGKVLGKHFRRDVVGGDHLDRNTLFNLTFQDRAIRARHIREISLWGYHIDFVSWRKISGGLNNLVAPGGNAGDVAVRTETGIEWRPPGGYWEQIMSTPFEAGPGTPAIPRDGTIVTLDYGKSLDNYTNIWIDMGLVREGQPTIMPRYMLDLGPRAVSGGINAQLLSGVFKDLRNLNDLVVFIRAISSTELELTTANPENGWPLLDPITIRSIWGEVNFSRITTASEYNAIIDDILSPDERKQKEIEDIIQRLIDRITQPPGGGGGGTPPPPPPPDDDDDEDPSTGTPGTQIPDTDDTDDRQPPIDTTPPPDPPAPPPVYKPNPGATPQLPPPVDRGTQPPGQPRPPVSPSLPPGPPPPEPEPEPEPEPDDTETTTPDYRYPPRQTPYVPIPPTTGDPDPAGPSPAPGTTPGTTPGTPTLTPGGGIVAPEDTGNVPFLIREDLTGVFLERDKNGDLYAVIPGRQTVGIGEDGEPIVTSPGNTRQLIFDKEEIDNLGGIKEALDIYQTTRAAVIGGVGVGGLIALLPTLLAGIIAGTGRVGVGVGAGVGGIGSTIGGSKIGTLTGALVTLIGVGGTQVVRHISEVYQIADGLFIDNVKPDVRPDPTRTIPGYTPPDNPGSGTNTDVGPEHIFSPYNPGGYLPPHI